MTRRHLLSYSIFWVCQALKIPDSKLYRSASASRVLPPWHQKVFPRLCGNASQQATGWIGMDRSFSQLSAALPDAGRSNCSPLLSETKAQCSTICGNGMGFHVWNSAQWTPRLYKHWCVTGSSQTKIRPSARSQFSRRREVKRRPRSRHLLQ